MVMENMADIIHVAEGIAWTRMTQSKQEKAMSKKLTKRQAGVYIYIYDYIRKNHYPPTVREIANAFDISSTNGVVEHLKALYRKGFIEKDAFKSRAIHPLVAREVAAGILNGEESEAISAPAQRRKTGRAKTQDSFTLQPLNNRHNLIQTQSHRQKSLRVLSKVIEGNTLCAAENVDRIIDIDPAIFSYGTEDCFALRVRGTSMIGDGIMPGDLVVVRPQTSAEDGEIIAALLDGTTTVKRYEKRKGIVYLVPSNESMEPIAFRSEEHPDFKILGSIRGVLRLYQ